MIGSRLRSWERAHLRVQVGYLVERLDDRVQRLSVYDRDLASLGYEDPESDGQIWGRVEYHKFEEFVANDGYTIEKWTKWSRMGIFF
eukprot:TRINITY_DN7026_c0_g1_i1.p1 TRINITY_DN7026_c0_g1~~TRINITY_DN7026_c0_g1_i1.p1  ORF type:complete len:87 (-),score=10.82 TRINITY_DN7026_c0_g1_i1:241-501(-)